ncbi:hypothetical protein Hypma_003189 [Hypsizygus marmoreus]|uniref:Uncharacterized protein n=1 Tax=Hypsizygus marmoreus TaxID=39966 RepID=A0A369JZ72_HYPMA|nr:hypothetical protein Hypma_003189 [Hypsizygus marmoreus]
MPFKSLFALLPIVISSNAAVTDKGKVLTVKKMYHIVIDKSFFLMGGAAVLWASFRGKTGQDMIDMQDD